MTRQATLRRIAREARPYTARLIVAVVLGTVAGLMPLVAPWAFKVLINDVLKAHKIDSELYFVLGLVFLSLVLGGLATYGATYVTAKAGQDLIAKLRVLLFERIIRLPLGEFDKWRPGELLTRFGTDLQLMSDAVTVSVPQLIVNTVTFVSSFAIMIGIDWLLTLSLIILAPIVSFAVSRFQKLIGA
ncbi:MAG: hypothetical protein JO165_08275, partial [Candidatus Eremiobacteraeota bacterium]|nr:hypothetical protein [Candidatus Eremiobacteraeota bacterium]